MSEPAAEDGRIGAGEPDGPAPARHSVAAHAWAALRQRCPRCCLGRVFRSRLAMNELCPACGFRLGREPGYFLGAMYFSYTIGVVAIGVAAVLVSLAVPDWSLGRVLLAAWIVFLPLLPWTFRVSRVLWLHFDAWFTALGESI